MEAIESGALGVVDPQPVTAVRTSGPDRRLLRIMVDGCATPLVLVDRDGCVVRANQACADMLSTTLDSLIGRPVWEVFPLTGDADGDDTQERWLRFAEGSADAPNGEQLSTDGIGNRRRVAWTYRPMSDDVADPCVVGTGVDVTRERLAEAHWRRKAQTDPLTGLANRAAFEETLRTLADPRTGLGCGVLFCDLDGFKAVNDAHGHSAGDQLLVEISGRLASAVRGNDLVARFGGDEFAILLPAVGLIEMRALSTRLERLVRRPIRLASGTVNVGVSIGLSVANPGDDPAAVLHAADEQMYAVKARRATRTVLTLH